MCTSRAQKLIWADWVLLCIYDVSRRALSYGYMEYRTVLYTFRSSRWMYTPYSTVRFGSGATAMKPHNRKQLLPYYSAVLWVCCTSSEHRLGGQSVRFIRRNNKRRICIQNTTGNISTRSPYTGTTGTLSIKYRNFKYYTTRRRVQPCISFAWLAEWLRYFLYDNLLRHHLLKW